MSPASDPNALRARREALLLRRLLRAYKAVNEETIRRVVARGHRGLRPSFTSLLGQLDTEGTRLSALATRMGVTRQAVSQLLVQVEEAGLVTREDDPTDARGVVVRFTAKGRRTLEEAVEVMEGLDRELATRLGARDLAKLSALLAALAEVVDPDGALGD